MQDGSWLRPFRISIWAIENFPFFWSWCNWNKFLDHLTVWGIHSNYQGQYIIYCPCSYVHESMLEAETCTLDNNFVNNIEIRYDSEKHLQWKLFLSLFDPVSFKMSCLHFQAFFGTLKSGMGEQQMVRTITRVLARISKMPVQNSFSKYLPVQV